MPKAYDVPPVVPAAKKADTKSGIQDEECNDDDDDDCDDLGSVIMVDGWKFRFPLDVQWCNGVMVQVLRGSRVILLSSACDPSTLHSTVLPVGLVDYSINI